jgi:hypothetical protein
VELDSEPRIALKQIALARDEVGACWNTGWQVENFSGAALTITAVHLPHGQFKSPVQHFRPALEVAPGASVQYQSIVQCHAPVGLVTENAFVILHCQWRGEAWRIFVRIRVDIKPAGEPHTATELITTQKVGFSGIFN